MGKVNCMLPISTKTPGQLQLESWWCWLPITSPPTDWKNVHELSHPPLWTITIKFLTTLSRSGHVVLRAWPPLPGKAIKQFFFFFLLHPKLSLRFHLVLVYRGQISATGLAYCLAHSIYPCNHSCIHRAFFSPMVPIQGDALENFVPQTMAQLGRVCYIFGVHQANKTSICFLIAMIDPIFCHLWKTLLLSWYYSAVQG